MKLGRADTDGLELGWSDGAELLEGPYVGSIDGRCEVVGWIDGFRLGLIDTVGLELG
eukprot:CAMPEP_0202005672 /NCGR_PEP_ID=MMETSP0905-20130828/10652_1 /ASSEMBLY_ACC=CAM_ASM_000554 /TAXON_ID=420261 /ORGANISM="Thalassiosira antarctica, Strain CCMP982" /LENGTH=56 /DNA_ID=CAMNT_0048563281 /DNA_START=109 /DNA_END=275 /DNA_ORIENTATION=+